MAGDLARPLVEGFRDAGVQKIFGMPGGGPNLDVIGCAEAAGIEFVLAHGETASCIMAGSYGRLTGTPGVALVTRGPGLASAVNGLAQATLDRFPLLLVSDIVSQEDANRVAHQRIDQVATTAPVTKWSGTLGARDQAEVVRSAATLALSAPAGAVHLAFDPSAEGDPAPVLPDPPPVDDDALGRARELCAAARRPVVVIGLDAVPHAGAVRAALATLDCPVLVTYEAKGTVPESSPTYAGLFTGAAVERPWLEQADLVLGLGLDPVEAMPGPWPYAAPVVMLHSHPVETSYFGEPHLVVGAYADHLELLIDCLRPDWPTGVAAEQRRVDVASLEHHTTGLSPHDVVRETRLARRDALMTVDAGAHMLVAMPLWETDEAGSVFISNGLATMGFSLPAAIGVALARPGRRVVCFIGDGGLGMVLPELETVSRLGLDLTVAVFNDQALTLIRLKQKEHQGGARAVSYGAVAFDQVATAMGVPGTVVTDLEGLRAALASTESGPSLVDARIDPAGYPHVMRATRG